MVGGLVTRKSDSCPGKPNRGVIAGEERYFADRFGAEYEAYRRRVRRWA
jgi:hypothetical protein